MGFDLAELKRAVARHGRVARVVIGAVQGSSPREVGAAMLVWEEGQSGTIGGGALEFEAARLARRALEPGADALSHHALGPDLGQCCGGRVTLWREVYDAARVANLDNQVIARATVAISSADANDPADMPLSVARLLDRFRACGLRPEAQLSQGWMIEAVHQATVPVWIWGAGHVGRALVDVLAPLPELEITWIDIAPDRFPADPPASVTCVTAAKPETLMAHAPSDAHHLILTYSHALDLALCHGALMRGFASAGVIGSATKWARFRSRLSALGHDMPAIETLTCPIGNPALGKHPTAIAVGVAAALLTQQAGQITTLGEQRA